ncbi:MAG: quinolinate synthase NadA [Eubacteriales bacterium]
MNYVIEEINALKQKKNAIILAHYYQRPEIQDIADVVGDSYYLSKIARDCDEELILFCGVKFMAESAKILSPEKTVLLPVLDAGCPMADMADKVEVVRWKQKHPHATVVAYINCSTEVKALSDVCVTSSSAVKIIEQLESNEILFLPDENLGGYLAEQFPKKEFILWKGFCITHKKIDPRSIGQIKKELPHIKILVHPECEKKVRDLSDYTGSTRGIIQYATEDSHSDFLIVTEEGILHELKKKNPHKQFFVPGKSMTCVNMKKTTLDDVYQSLLHQRVEINIDEELRLRALKSLQKMHKLSR